MNERTGSTQKVLPSGKTVSRTSAIGQSVAIVGGGASGSLLAAQLLRRAEPGTHVTLVERSGSFGPGVAYGASSDAHRLNVAASNMAPLPKDPEAFFNWSLKRDPRTRRDDFLPRRIFGEYLCDLLDESERRAANIVTLERCDDEAVGLAPSPNQPSKRRLALKSGREIEADEVILALGNSAPAPPAVLPRSVRESPHFLADPWVSGELASCRADQVVLLVGTGLTMVDVALELGVTGGPVMYAVSRSGLVPRMHLPEPISASPVPLDASAMPRLDQLVAALTGATIAAAGRGEDWRAVIDSMRPVTNDLWQALAPEEQDRFEREFARIWSVHRHRMAPQVGAALLRLTEKGRLRIQAASIRSARLRDGAVDVDLTATPDGAPIRLRVDRIVNCTGPLHDPGRIDAPLVQDLVARGSVRSNRLGVGFDTAPDGTVLNRDGRPERGVHAIGPLRAGSLLETTAIPEIALQAREIATGITGNVHLRPARQTRPVAHL